MPEKRYIVSLSDIDRMVVRQDTKGKTVLAFSVQLELLIDGKWHRAIRYDSAHGKPHRHTFYPDGTEFRTSMMVSDLNVALTESQSTVRHSFQNIRRRYEAYVERMV